MQTMMPYYVAKMTWLDMIKVWIGEPVPTETEYVQYCESQDVFAQQFLEQTKWL